MTTEELQPFIDISQKDLWLIPKLLKAHLATIEPENPATGDLEADNSKIRTDQQRKAQHAWFRDVAKTCLEVGATVQDILKPTMDLQVDEDFIKWIFRRIGKKKYGKISTTQHTKLEVNAIQDEMIKFFAEKVDPPIELPPWPHDPNKGNDKIKGITLAKKLPYPKDEFEGEETGTFWCII